MAGDKLLDADGWRAGDLLDIIVPTAKEALFEIRMRRLKMLENVGLGVAIGPVGFAAAAEGVVLARSGAVRGDVLTHDRKWHQVLGGDECGVPVFKRRVDLPLQGRVIATILADPTVAAVMRIFVSVTIGLPV